MPEKTKNPPNQEKLFITHIDVKITKEILDIPSFTLPIKKKPRYGFKQFNLTNYQNHP